METSPVVRLMVQVLAIVVLSRLLSRALRFIGQPPVIAEIVVGILLGPSLLGWLAPETSAWLFPPESLPTLAVVSQLGLVFFMFLVGLEFDASLLRGRFRSALAVSNAGVVLPFALGVALSVPLHEMLAPHGVPRSSFALFLGVSMSITAFPVLARILGERGLLGTTAGAMSLASAAVDDLTAWCVLAVVVGIVNAEGPGAGLTTTIAAIAYTAIMLGVVRPVVARLGPRGTTTLSPDVVAVIVSLLLVSSTVTEVIGIHAVFGGFLLGAVMPRGGGLSASLVDKLEDFVTIVLLPLFFAYSGLRTQIALLDDASDWLLCLLIIGVAIAGKFGGSALTARVVGMGWRDSVALGILMNTRGLMELIVLNIGLDLGVISPRLFTMLVIMALVTTFMTAPLLALVLRTRAAAPKRMPIMAAAVDVPPVLLCVSDPAVARSLVTVAAALTAADRVPLEALYVVPADRDSAVLPGERSAQHHAPLAAAEDRAKELAVDLRTTSFVSGDVSADIASFADARGASLVLVGVHRPVFLSGSLGGVVGEVLATCSVPVCVLVDRGLLHVKRVLLLVGDDAVSAAATRVAERFRASGCEVIALPTGTLDAAYDPAVLDACRSVDLAVCALTGKTSLLAQGVFFPGMDDSAPVPCSILGVSARS